MKELSQKELLQVSGGNSWRFTSGTNGYYNSGNYGFNFNLRNRNYTSSTFSLSDIGFGSSRTNGSSSYNYSATGSYNFGRNNRSSLNFGYSNGSRNNPNYELGYTFRF